MSNPAHPQLPESKDLISQIQFASEDGKIWFNEQRMLLIHSAVMGQLRKELIETLGVERTRGFLMRFGYYSGLRDAEMAHKIRPDITKDEAFLAGPQLHNIKGMVKVVPTELSFDVETGHFHGEFDWYDSYEAEVHRNEYGPSETPICWTLLGYASGFSSYYMGRKIFFKETQCSCCGADHCHIVGKPAEEWEDSDALERALLPDPIIEELFKLQHQVSTLQESFRSPESEEDLLFNSVGRSASFKNVCQLISKASKSKVTVLLLGETGVGKEVVAKGLHASSDRRSGPFVAVNCACIPPDLIEAELFGVEKGAYTGATQSREGKFERANHGTIFLDEVIELSPRAQASLLRVLQESELERVGDSRTRRIDVRVVAATNEDLEDAVKAGRFRADLFYRLNVYPVHIPPLRDRSEDIPLLIEHFLQKYHTLYNKRTTGVTDKALQALTLYKWPGNIRELENMIERGVILADNNRSIGLESFFPSLAEPTHPLNVINGRGLLDAEPSATTINTQDENWMDGLLGSEFSIEHLEQELIRRAMSQSGGNVSKAARMLGLSRPALAYRLKKLDDAGD
jgi:DNA-binding NtrC family response regulator